MSKIQLGVMFGSRSCEHEVSIISAVQLMRAADRQTYDVIPVYISKKGEFLYHPSLCQIEPFRDLDGVDRIARKVMLVRTEQGVEMLDTAGGFSKRKPIARIDFALPIVHGTNCEDGTLQGFFELLGLPYAGCDLLASALGMDKVACKKILEAAGLPVLPCVSFSARQWAAQGDQIARRIEEEIGYPVIVKPVNLGSSVGIKKAGDREQLLEAVTVASSFAGQLMAERAVEQLREMNCAVLGDSDAAEASVCEEPLMSDEILSYQDKYLGGGKVPEGTKGMSSLKRRLPAEISDEKSEEIRSLALRAFAAIGCSGVVRIDFLLDTMDQNRVYINELNTIPGSLAFYLFEATGMPYRELLDRLVSLGFSRQRKKNNLMFTLETNLLSQAQGFGAKGSQKLG